MKKYRITSYIFAKNILEATKKFQEAEIVQVDLQGDIEEPEHEKKRAGFK